jgi:azurin
MTKLRTSLLSCAALAAALTTSGQPNGGPAATPGPRVVEITANDTMKYSVTAISAAPGEDLKVTLTNLGSLPKEAMAHNWVLLKAGADAGAFSNASVMAKATDYLPPSLQDEVVAQIGMQGPHQTGEVEFHAPTAPGDYTYLCTFPAHYQIGMRGTLTVK